MSALRRGLTQRAQKKPAPPVPSAGPAGGTIRDATPRLRRRRRRRRLRGAAIALGAVAVLAGLTWLIGFSAVFAVDAVQVSGTEAARAADVVTAAQVPLGQPLIRLDSAAVTDRVAALPWVATSHVVRHLSGTVEIVVTERTPVFALVQADGYGLVDATGRAFDRVTELPAGLVPVTLATATPRLLADAATVVAALPQAVRDQVTGLSVTSADHFEFSLASGASLFWGSAEDSSLKAEAAAALLTVPARYYDVSAPAYPAARP